LNYTRTPGIVLAHGAIYKRFEVLARPMIAIATPAPRA